VEIEFHSTITVVFISEPFTSEAYFNCPFLTSCRNIWLMSSFDRDRSILSFLKSLLVLSRELMFSDGEVARSIEMPFLA